MSEFYTNVNFLDRTHLFADYYKMITCLTLKKNEIENTYRRLSRYSGFGIDSQIYNLKKCCQELDDLKEDIRTEYNSLVEIIDTINRYEKKAAETLENDIAREQTIKAVFEIMKKFISAISDRPYILPNVLPFIRPSAPSSLFAEGFVEGPGYELSTDNPGITAWLGKGHAGFEADDCSGEVNAYVGKVDAQAKTGFSFMNTEVKKKYKDGKWVEDDSFSVINAEIGAGVTANVIAADVSATAGDDMLGVDFDASGGVGNGELSGKGEFSIGEDGVNFNASGKAMVSAVEGEVSGTINILGFEIKATAGGYAGAIGAEGEIGIKDNKFVINGGAAAGIGGKVGLEIGFNDTGWNEFVDFITFWD